METGNKYVHILKHHKWFALVLFAIVLVAVSGFTFTSPKIYKVAADLYIAPKPVTITGNSYVFANYEYQMLNNQIEILRSDEVATNAVAAVKKAMKEDPDFGYDNYPVSKLYLQGAMRVKKKENASVLNVEMTGSPLKGNPRELQKILAVYLESYQGYVKKTNSAKARGEREFLMKELAKAEASVQDWGDKLKEFQANNQTYNIDTEINQMITNQDRTGEQIRTLNADIAAVSKEIASARKQLPATPEYINFVARLERDPETSRLRQNLVDLEKERAEWAAKITDAHPKMQTMKQEIEKVTALLQDRLDTYGKVYTKETAPAVGAIVSNSGADVTLATDIINNQIKLDTLRAKQGVYQNTISQIAGKLKDVPEKKLEYAELKTRFDMAQDKYVLLQKRLDEAQILEEVSKLERVDVIKIPEFPIKIKPDWKKNMTAGVMLGICFALFAVFVRASLDRTLLWPFQVQGMIEDNPITTSAAVFNLPTLPSKAACAQMMEKTNFSVPEPYKRLVIHLENLSKKEQVRRIGVIPVSPFAECNITTIALGLYLTELSNKMVLIDTDYSNHSLTRLIGRLGLPMSGAIENGPGLSDYLSGDVDDFVDIIYPLGKTVYGSFIPAGRPIHEAGFQFSHKNLGQLEANLSPNYNFVLYSLSSLEKSFDSIAVGRTLDGVLLLVHPGVTQLEQVHRAIQELETIGCPLLGVMFQPLE